MNYNLLADGKLDIDYDFYATGSAGLIRTTEALGTPNAVAASAPTVQYAAPLNLGFYKKFNRFFMNGTVNATKYWYEDYSVITLPGPAGRQPRAHGVHGIAQVRLRTDRGFLGLRRADRQPDSLRPDDRLPSARIAMPTASPLGPAHLEVE